MGWLAALAGAGATAVVTTAAATSAISTVRARVLSPMAATRWTLIATPFETSHRAAMPPATARHGVVHAPGGARQRAARIGARRGPEGLAGAFLEGDESSLAPEGRRQAVGLKSLRRGAAERGRGQGGRGTRGGVAAGGRGARAGAAGRDGRGGRRAAALARAGRGGRRGAAAGGEA